MDGKLETFS